MSSDLTRRQARARLAARFQHAGIASADIDARLLLCAACGISHAELIAEPGVALGVAEAVELEAYALRRLAREPVSRILGRREFWGLDFTVTPEVLDPRPDTESLVAAVVDAIGRRRAAPLRLLDLGTGSGAILAALLSELPGAYGLGLDRSLGACSVAAGNLRALGLAGRSSIVCGSWLAPLGGRFDAIFSNPPYVASAIVADLDPDVRDHDPMAALDGGADGLDAYRAILADLPARLAPEGVAAFECGFDQGDVLSALMREAGLRGVTLRRDLAGHPRVVVGLA